MTPTSDVLRDIRFGSLREIADLELQRKTWLDPTNTNPHWSYVEFVCSYPDDDQLTDGQDNGWLSPTEARVLSEFRKILVAHQSPTGDHVDNAAVLNDPAWHEVVRQAQAALREPTG